ncbi:hypothetical protein V8F20_005407 [Naviculisporaceae sp. PSN 640]
MAPHPDLIITRQFETSSSPPPPPPPPSNSTFEFNATAIWGPITDTRPSRQPSIIASSIVALLVAAVFVSLRFYTRRRLKILSPSDWAILPALICSAGVTASQIEQAYWGAGRHSWEIEFSSLAPLQRAGWYGMLFYGASLSFTRISILLLYRRIFTYNWAKRAIEVSLVVVAVLGIWFIISVCTACVPLQAYWRWDLMFGPNGEIKATCLPYQIWWMNAALHLASDLVIIALPMPILSTLKLPKRQKYALVGVFALGFFVCLISILRLIALIDMTLNPSWDGAYSSADLVYWTAAEVNAAIVCACAMTLKPLVMRLFPRLLGGRSGRFGGGGGAGGNNSLPWITPITGDEGIRSDARSLGSQSHRRASGVRNSFRQSFSWGISSSGGKAGSVRTVEEREFRGQKGRDGESHYFGCDDLMYDLKDMDHELDRAQRSDSVSTGIVVAGGRTDDGDDGDSLLNGHPGVERRPATGGGERGDLAAPPTAHLRLSIHVTKSVHVTKSPSSPVPAPEATSGSDDDHLDEKGADGILPGGPPSSTFGNRMG